ncbi:amidohydrolase [Pseudomonas asplenii]|uniref:amidohydrolase family protein n=1 Tax=Pseudomonas asplenii TaxID=53407 RepID=UPI0037C8F456
MTLYIDAHQHYWRLGSDHGDWPPARLPALYKDFGPEDMAAQLRDCAINGTIAVQSNPHRGDTHFLLGLADKHDSIMGVVGWVDLLSPEAEQELKALARHPKFKGVRAMLQDLPASNWIEDSKIQPAIDALITHDLSLDVLVLPRHLAGVLKFAKRNRALRIVIDHAGKPDIANREIESWLPCMQELAALSNVHCKLSGLLTEAAPGDGLKALRPYMDHVLETFGTHRVIWGSDWPVVNLVSAYTQWWHMCQSYLHDHEVPAVRENAAAVMGMNASRFYRIDFHPPP